MRALQNRGRADVLLLFAYGVFRTGKNHHDAVIAVIDGLLHRNRISDAPVVIRDAVDHIRFARHRHRRRRLHDVVIVVAHIRLVEILRGTIVRIAGHHGEFGRIRRKRLVIHRILAIVVAQRAVHIIEVRVIVVLHIAVEARVFLTERVLRVERVVSPVLSGNVGNHIGAAGGNTIAMVDMYAVLQHAVHHTRAVNRAETAADVDHRCPVGHMRPSFRKSVPFAGFHSTLRGLSGHSRSAIKQRLRQLRDSCGSVGIGQLDAAFRVFRSELAQRFEHHAKMTYSAFVAVDDRRRIGQ